MSTFRALRHRNYRLYYGGQIVSLTGTWMQQIAQAWLMYSLTGSPWMLGIASFASRAPVFVLSLPVGVWSEKADRRRWLMVMQALALVQAAALAAITLSGHVTPLIVVLFSLLLGCINAVDLPVRQTFVGDLVPAADLPSAVGLNSTAVNGARIVGPAVAGAVVAAVGEGYCFLINAVSFLAVLLGLALMRETPKAAKGDGSSFAERLGAGFAYLRGNRSLLVALAMVATVSFTGMPYITLMPAFVAERLAGGPDLLGWLMAASGVGAMFGAVLLAGRKSEAPLLRLVFGSTALMGLGLIGLAFAHAKWPAMAALFVTGLGMMLALAAANTYLQTRTAPQFRARVMSVYTVAFVGLAPFGGLLGGAAAERLSLTAVLAASGILNLLLTLALLPRSQKSEVKSQKSAQDQ